jgi:hypothetical protein
MKRLGAHIIFCSVLLFAFACNKDKNLPNQPHIDFIGFTSFTDSATLKIKFNDGDGDIGNLNNGDGDNITLQYKYYDTNGNLTDGIISGYNFKAIYADGYQRETEGEIHINLYAPFAYEKFKLAIVLKDRAANLSNELTTPDLVP